jgi:hypothetical protein
MKLSLGAQDPKLRPSKIITCDDEILWPYSMALKMPTTAHEENTSKIGGIDKGYEWSFNFSRSDVITNLTMFRTIKPLEYAQALALVQRCVNCSPTEIIARFRDLDITADMFAKCRMVPDDCEKDSKKSKGKKVKALEVSKCNYLECTNSFMIYLCMYSFSYRPAHSTQMTQLSTVILAEMVSSTTIYRTPWD